MGTSTVEHFGIILFSSYSSRQTRTLTLVTPWRQASTCGTAQVTKTMQCSSARSALELVRLTGHLLSLSARRPKPLLPVAEPEGKRQLQQKGRRAQIWEPSDKIALETQGIFVLLEFLNHKKIDSVQRYFDSPRRRIGPFPPPPSLAQPCQASPLRNSKKAKPGAVPLSLVPELPDRERERETRGNDRPLVPLIGSTTTAPTTTTTTLIHWSPFSSSLKTGR